MSDKDVLKANALVAVFSVLTILVGIFLPFLSVILPVAEYDQLTDRQVVVQSVEWVQQTRGSSYYRMFTENDGWYVISGNYNAAQVEERITGGKTVSIKYYENKLLFASWKYAEVIIADGECIVSYNNDEDDDGWILYVMTVGCLLIGAGGIFFVVWEIKRNRKDRERRDRQIMKKYGHVK